jgi:hypothetical protein
MPKALAAVVWALIALLGAGALASIAFTRGEPVNGIWFVVAASATYLVAYRFYSAFLAARVLGLDDTRATPAERLDDGRDFCPTNKWVVIGHHFAAIAGPGPLVGPTLAAQFGTCRARCGSSSARCPAAASGFRDPALLPAAQRKSLGQMARGGEPARWHDRARPGGCD